MKGRGTRFGVPIEGSPGVVPNGPEGGKGCWSLGRRVLGSVKRFVPGVDGRGYGRQGFRKKGYGRKGNRMENFTMCLRIDRVSLRWKKCFGKTDREREGRQRVF